MCGPANEGRISEAPSGKKASPPDEGFFLLRLLKIAAIADKIITLDSHASYTLELFSLWLGLSVAAGTVTAI
ncbi:hypothetical protein ABR27_10340 [Enterobacter hormaechei subsp. hormaechei]|nr:hypothetical protein ABR27_10340 [Enterobacter hormaechei subsp. hormaechei]